MLPGVDLTVRADVTGFSQLLVVKSAQAAANRALATLRFTTSTSGLSLRRRPDASLAAVDGSGAEVFTAPAAYMWDASGGPDASMAPSGRITMLPAQLRAGQLTLTPDQAALKAAKYPVYIDPSLVR